MFFRFDNAYAKNCPRSTALIGGLVSLKEKWREEDGREAESLLGARSETSFAFDLMKKMGYPLSLGFLIFTLIIQLHEYKHISRKKKTISKRRLLLSLTFDTLIVTGLIMLYLDLIRRSWEKELNIDFKQCKGCKGRDFIK